MLMTDKESKHITEILQKKQIKMTAQDIVEVIRFFSIHTKHVHPLPRLEYRVQSLLFVLNNGTLKFFIFYLALSILAFSGKYYFLYSIHMLDIIVDYERLEPIRHSEKRHQSHHFQQVATTSHRVLDDHPSLLLRTLRLHICG